jgi:hypothetical protein
MGSPTNRPRSGFAQGLLYAGGIAGIYALIVVISAVTGQRFEIPSKGGGRGIPLPSGWFHAALFTGIGVALWLSGRQWDRPGFVAVRARRRWLMPTLIGVVIVPAALVLLFLLVR